MSQVHVGRRAVFPWIGILTGAGLFLGFGWLFVDSLLDLRAFPVIPREVGVAEATAKADPGRGAWVKLTDLRLPCDIEPSIPASGSYTYRLGTGPSGSERIVVSADGPLPCSDDPAPLVGTLSSTRPGRVVGVEFEGHEWKSWPTPYQITLWTHGGPDDAKIGLWLGPIFALLGLFITLYYARAAAERRSVAVPLHDNAGNDPVETEVPRVWEEGDSVLPPTQLPLSSRYFRTQTLTTGFLMVAGLMLAVLGVIPTADEIGQFIQERDVWQSGQTPSSLKMEGQVASRALVFKELKLSLVYEQPAGTTYRRLIHASSLFTSLEGATPIEVRVDPRDPTRVATSWTSVLTVGRILGWAMYGLLAVLGFFLFWMAFKVQGQTRGVKSLGARRSEVLVRVLGVETVLANGIDVGNRKYRFENPFDGKTFDLLAGSHEPPPLVVEGHALAVCPWGQQRPLTIVRDGFYPFELTLEELRQSAMALKGFVREKAEAGRRVG